MVTMEGANKVPVEFKSLIVLSRKCVIPVVCVKLGEGM